MRENDRVFQNLREKFFICAQRLVQQVLGPRFSVREFHDRVLEDGSLTLPMLRNKIERWIVQSRASTR